MRLVVDSNVVFASLLRDGTTRSLVFDPSLSLVAPEAMLSEILRHREEIVRRSHLTGHEFDLLLRLVTADIEIVPRSGFVHRLPDARRAIGDRDPGDVPFLAVALAVPCDGIWTHNVEHFEGAGVEIWTTAKVVDRLR